MKEYLRPTYYIDSDNPKIVEFARQNCKDQDSDTKKAVNLYYAVRDGVKYDPYSIDISGEYMKASYILERGYGYCVAKGVLLASCLRSLNIPARLGFSDVRNHLATKKFTELIETNVFFYHCYVEIFLDNRWLKTTPAFDMKFCRTFNVPPLEFDGTEDSLFHEFDNTGKKYMEYIKNHGSFADLPWDTIISEMLKRYPKYFRYVKKSGLK